MFQIIGPVVDLRVRRFDDPRAKIFEWVEVDETWCEVQQIIGDGVARTVAMRGTDGMKRRIIVSGRKDQLEAPVGVGVSGRILNVLGAAGDLNGGGKIGLFGGAGVVGRLSLYVEMCDSMVPYRRGGKIGFGGAGVGNFYLATCCLDVLLFIDKDATTVLSRTLASKAVFSAFAIEVRETLQRYLQLSDSIAGTQDIFVAEFFTNSPEKYVALAGTIAGLREILDGNVSNATTIHTFAPLSRCESMTMIVRPDLKSRTLLAQLTKGVGHNSYGEQAWPNDLLYMFPISILGIFGAIVSFAVLEPTPLGEPADPYATPYEILPEWFLFPTFQILRVVPNKLLGIALITAVPLGLIAVPFLEAGNRFQNPVRRPIASVVFVAATIATIVLGRDATRAL